LALAVVFSVALVSCGNKQAAAEDSANVEVAEVAVAEDTVKVGDSVDTVVAAAGEVVEGQVPVAEEGK
ncbi:MAG: hypothetical protein K2N25_07150, partial [Muribaculaceae bacterium]|nr:hypothetical protein [Muribaculaceae bacterium]